MGRQLDSLADIIAFGVAPAFLFATYYSAAAGWVRFGVALPFVLAGAYRLARFHAEPDQSFFRGLPITAGGTLLALVVTGPFGAGVWATAMTGIALTVLMVCRHPFPKLGPSRHWLLPGLGAALLPVALWPQVETLALVAGLVLASYVLWGVAGMVLGDKLQAIGIHAGEVPQAGQPRA
jgi:phosphatidylserine synthase